MNNIFDHYDRSKKNLDALNEKQQELREEVNKLNSSINKTKNKISNGSKTFYIRRSLIVGENYKVRFKNSLPMYADFNMDTVGQIEFKVISLNKKSTKLLFLHNNIEHVVENIQIFNAVGYREKDAIELYRTYTNREKNLNSILND
jgi:hypothetical protein